MKTCLKILLVTSLFFLACKQEATNNVTYSYEDTSDTSCTVTATDGHGNAGSAVYNPQQPETYQPALDEAQINLTLQRYGERKNQ